MTLSIRNEETCRLARELARLTGETMTGAITLALRERLAREERRRDLDVRVEELLAIGRRGGESAARDLDLLLERAGIEFNPGTNPADRSPAGMLLYATDRHSFRHAYGFSGHPIEVRSLDLGQAWPDLRRDLHDLANDLAGLVGSSASAA